ncbi:MAG: flagellar regulator YcgR PilZN domain-containing protein, partial [Burkholderiales bacterium]
IEEEKTAMITSSATLESPDFLVRSRLEVLRLLSGVMCSGTLMSINFLHTDQVAVTSLVYVDEASNMLLLECPHEWQSLMDGGDAESIMLACVYEDAKIQFQSGRGTIVDLDGTTVVGLDIPEFMWRFQRRRDERHKVSGLTITLNLGFIECDAEVTDLSMGGIGMFNCDAEVQLEHGEVLHNCAIALPGVGAIMVDLTVQHQMPMRTADGQAVTRVGCEFSGLSDSARQLIAHYLDALVIV